jgi:hypothetical protein
MVEEYDDWEIGENSELLDDGTRVGESYQEEFQEEVSSGNNQNASGSSVVEIPDRPSVIIESYEEIPESRGNVYSNFEDGETLELTFPQPNISKDAGTKTIEHDIIGGKTVLQKIGEEATEIEIEGICTRDESMTIDEMVNDDVIYVRSHRHEGYAVLDSASTSPISDGGGIIGVTNGGKEFNWSHEFTISCKEIEKPERI